MFMTLTMAPALDVTTQTSRVLPTHKLRCSSPDRFAGGGGINVARMLQLLGDDVIALAPLGGPIGQAYALAAQRDHVPLTVVEVVAQTRETLTIRQESNGAEYSFIFPAPELTSGDWRQVADRVKSMLRSVHTLVVSGSVPLGMSHGHWQELADLCREQNVSLVIDSHGNALKSGVECGASGIKPSLAELEALVGTSLNENSDIVIACQTLLQKHDSLKWVIVTRQDQGSILVMRDTVMTANAPSVQVRSSVGAGDAFLAGWLSQCDQGNHPEEALSFAAACGAAMANRRPPDLPGLTQIKALRESVSTSQLDA